MQRDLSSHDVWEESLRRSRERRERAAAQRPRVELPARGVSLAAALALTGGSAAAAASGDGWEPQEIVSGAAGGSAPPAAKVHRVAKAQRTAKVQRTAARGVPKQAVLGATARSEAKPVRARTSSTSSTVRPTTAVIEREEAPDQEATPVSATSAQAEPAEAAVASRRGGGVRDLQRKLGVTADGDFGPATERALRRWQRRHGLTADGIAGPQTRKALGLGAGRVLKRERPARRARRRAHGRRGGGVVALQRALGVSADGVFGPGTERALKRWQRDHGLAADGVAGPQTRRALGLGSGPLLKRKGGGGPSGGRTGVVQRVIAAANAIASKPYRYGGGHGSFTDSGYDCSGSVSYALHGGGLLSSPLDSSAFMSWGVPGPGRRITIYAHPGHMYMVVDGRRFDTSARFETGSRWTTTQRSTAGYVARHPAGL